MWSKQGWAEIEQIFYYSIPGALLIGYGFGFILAIEVRITTDAAFLATALLASIPAGFIAYQAYTSDLFWVYSHAWRRHDQSAAFDLIASKFSHKDESTQTRIDLAKRVLIVISNEKDPSGYGWKLVNLVNSRGVCTFVSVVGSLIPVGWATYVILSSYARNQIFDFSQFTPVLFLRISIYYLLTIGLAISFYRAIPKILKQLASYNEILVARNAPDINQIASELGSGNSVSRGRVADEAKTIRKKTIVGLLGQSGFELTTIAAGTGLGIAMDGVLRTRGLEPLAFFVLLIPTWISIVVALVRRLLWPHHIRPYRLAERSVHWLLGSVGGAFIGLLIAGAPGLLAVDLSFALLVAGVFLFGMFAAVLLPNFLNPHDE